jgi:sulfur-carrier protein
MTVRVLLPRMLTEHAGGARELEVAWAPDATLGDVIAEVATLHPALGRRIVDEAGDLRRFVNLYVDGEECRRIEGLETRVADGSVVQVIGSIAGG